MSQQGYEEIIAVYNFGSSEEQGAIIEALSRAYNDQVTAVFDAHVVIDAANVVSHKKKEKAIGTEVGHRMGIMAWSLLKADSAIDSIEDLLVVSYIREVQRLRAYLKDDKFVGDEYLGADHKNCCDVFANRVDREKIEKRIKAFLGTGESEGAGEREEKPRSPWKA